MATDAFEPSVSLPSSLNGLPIAKPAFKQWLRVHLTYLCRHGHTLSLNSPRRLTELIQKRKLFDRNPQFPRLMDKVGAKHFVRDRLGAEWITPTLWSGAVLPEIPPWRKPFIVKSRHGCNQQHFVRSGKEDWQAIRRASASWMRKSYGYWLDEWGYCDIPRGLLVEPFVGDDGELPIDYKLFVFHGKVEFVQVHLDREFNHRWIVFDRYWHRVSSPSKEADPTPPVSIDEMISGAELLGRFFDFVRIDLYEVGGRPRFGEMTFYPGSGLQRVTPPALDFAMGAYWLDRPEAHPR